MCAIFISYRRDDAEGQAGRLFDDLTQHFGDDAVFMDVAAIEPGRDFRRVIDEHVASCGVLLAIIGKIWLTAKDESGVRRLNDPMDLVRLETASALKRDIPVVPVLVHGARMPRAEDLPEDLKELAFRNGLELTHARWDSDVQVLVKALRPYVQAKQEPARPRPPSAPSEPGPTRTGSSLMIIAALVGVLVLTFGGYVWHQKSSEDAARETAAQKEAKRLATAAEEEKARAEADTINKEKIAADEATARRAKALADAEARKKDLAEKTAIQQAKEKKTAVPEKPDVSGYWRDDDGVLYRIVAEKRGDYDMGRIEPPEDSGVYRNVRIDGREIEIAIGVLPSGTQQEVANLKLSVDGNIMAGLRKST